MLPKLKWTVGSEPTGRYRSFEHRAWPSADWPNGEGAAFIACEESYTPARARQGGHAPLTVYVAVYRADGIGFDNRRLKSRPATIAEAKQLVERYFTANPAALPGAYRPKS